MDDLKNQLKDITGMDEAKVDKVLEEANEDKKRYLATMIELNKDSAVYKAALGEDKHLIIELMNNAVMSDLKLMSSLKTLMESVNTAYAFGYRRGKM